MPLHNQQSPEDCIIEVNDFTYLGHILAFKYFAVLEKNLSYGRDSFEWDSKADLYCSIIESQPETLLNLK